MNESNAHCRILTTDGLLYVPYNRDEMAILRATPGACRDGTGRWRVSLDLAGRRALLAIADHLGIEVAPELRNLPPSEAALRAAQAGLYPFQVEGVDWLSRRKRGLLADEMGLGKTVQALLALPVEAATLVVCPASLKYNWAEEVRQWRPDLAPTVLSGKGSFRTPQPGEVVILNYELLPPELERASSVAPSLLQALKSTHVILDEAHLVKNRKTNRSKRAGRLVSLSDTAWGLTGTPLLNRPGDLYDLLERLELAEDVFGSFPRYIELFSAKPGIWGGFEWGEPKPEVPWLLLRGVLRRRRAEVLPQLPPKRYETLMVDLNGSLRGDLDEAWEQWEQWRPGREELPPFEQIASVRERLARSRVRAALDIADLFEESGEPLVVFSAHQEPVVAFGKRPGWGKITGQSSAQDRQQTVEAFQRGELKGIACTIQAGGVGLNLTQASTVLFVDQSWVPAENLQAEDRVCRIGQGANSVRIIRMVSNHPLDRQLLRVLDRKARLVTAAIERPDTDARKSPRIETEEEG